MRLSIDTGGIDKDKIQLFLNEKLMQVPKSELLFPLNKKDKKQADDSVRLQKQRAIFKNELNIYTVFLENQENVGLPFYEGLIEFLFQLEDAVRSSFSL